MELTERQKEITEAALNLIAEQGIQNLTIRNLSKAIGVTEAAIYRHFSSKQEIIHALLQRCEDAVEWDENLRGWAALRSFALGRISLILQRPELSRVFFSEEIFQNDEECRAMLQEMTLQHKGCLKDRFLEAQEDGELRRDIPLDTLFCLVFGPVRLLIKQWGLSNRAFDLKQRGMELLDTLKMILHPAE